MSSSSSSSFGVHCYSRIYVNPSGNISASGYFKSHVTQELANKFPEWTHLRDNTNSIGQQFLTPMARQLHYVERDQSDSLDSNFLSLAHTNDIDILNRVKVPSVIDLTSTSASGIRCITGPSGVSPSGTDNDVWINEVNDLKEFYYHVLPTRMCVFTYHPYTQDRLNDLGISFNFNASGVYDTEQKYIDKWKREHDITWQGSNSNFRKQDSESLETYESFKYGMPETLLGFTYHDDVIWWHSVANDRNHYVHISNPRTTIGSEYLDRLASYNFCDHTLYTNAGDPSGIAFDNTGDMWITDDNKVVLIHIELMHDYFILDKENRYIYFREDYRNPGVFISNN